MLNLRNLLSLLTGLGVVSVSGMTRAADPIPDPTELLLKEVNEVPAQPFCCMIAGEHPMSRLDGDSDGSQTMCECETCQRWAFGVLQQLRVPFRSSPAAKALDRVDRAFFGISVDIHAHQQQSIQKADELGVLHEWVEQRYGKHAIWPARCGLTAIPAERQLMTLPQSMTLCHCANYQRWALSTLRTLSDRVVQPLIQGEKQEALTALTEILTETRSAGRDLRANRVYPDWLRQVRGHGTQPFCCDSTGNHPERAVTADNADDNQKLCQCGPCQRWAARTLMGFVAMVGAARYGDKEMALRLLKSNARISAKDYEGARIRERERAQRTFCGRRRTPNAASLQPADDPRTGRRGG